MTIQNFGPGGYNFIPGVFQYSGGVSAAQGYEIVRVTFRQPLALAQGFANIEAHLAEAGRPRAALCACELRSPAPFTEDGFKSFNESYASVLKDWGIFRDGVNSVARTNICPELSPPSEPGIHGFCYTIPSSHRQPTFVVSGSGEVPEGKANYRDHIVRPGDTTVDGLREKARFVLAAMEARLAALGSGWPNVTAVQVYTVHDFHPFLGQEFVERGAARCGLTWHYSRPPVSGLDFEMDCRGMAREIVI